MRESSMLPPRPQQPGSHTDRGMVPFQQAYLMICEAQLLNTMRMNDADIEDSFDDLHYPCWKSWISEW